MKFTTATILAVLIATPLGAEPMNRNPLDWIASGIAYMGKASDPQIIGDQQPESYTPRRSRNIGYGQTMRGGVNSNDRGLLTTTVDAGGEGIADLSVRFRDLTDESRAIITLRDYSGNVIDKTRLAKAGRSANGDVYVYTPDLGQPERRAVTLDVRTFGGRNGDGNGWSARIDATPGCQMTQSFMATRGKSGKSRGGKGRKD